MVIEKAKIEADAKRAAESGKTPNEACPYPFATDEGMHWMAVFILAGGKR